MTIFKETFSTLQYIGFGILFLAYCVDFTKAMWWDGRQEAKKKKERMEKEKSKSIMIQNAIGQIRETMSRASSYMTKGDNQGRAGPQVSVDDAEE